MRHPVPRRAEAPVSLVVVIGLLTGALGAAWWSLERAPRTTTGAASGAAPVGSDDDWTARGWSVGPASPVDRSVVRITTTRCGDRIRGSGVIVDGAVLTNRHVVDRAHQVVLTRADGSTVEVTSIAASSGVDVARLTAPGLGDGLRLASASGEQLVGSAGTLIGFPGGHDVARRPVTVDGTRRGWGFPDPQRPLHLAVDVVPGESGSPVVDATDAVVGLVYARSNDDGAGLAISAAELRRLTGDLTGVPFEHC